MKEILTRITSESPTFFKRIQAIGLSIGSIGTTILLIPASLVALPAVVLTIAGYMVAVGLVAAGGAALPVKDPSVLTKKD